MPVKDNTKIPFDKIERAVKRYLDKEATAAQIAKEFKISRSGFYGWVERVKRNTLEKSNRAGMSARDIAKSNRMNELVTLDTLRKENERLRQKLFELLIQKGEL